MSNHEPFANEAVVADYLADLLKPELPHSHDAPPFEQQTQTSTTPSLSSDSEKIKAGSKLLATAALAEQANEQISNKVVVDDLMHQKNTTKILEQDKEILPEVENSTEIVTQLRSDISLKERLGVRFQALFFDVAGLTLAVPLVELGGIHKISSISHIVGKPAWFKGVMIRGSDKINCVDSARWVMPEQYSEKLQDSIHYRYLVMLDKSPWGLMSEALINTVELTKDDVKWRADTTKRPWLAGMVKEKMCALIDVSSFLQMLESDMPSH